MGCRHPGAKLHSWPRVPLLVLLTGLVVTALVRPGLAPPRVGAQATAVHYAAGWNLVAAPTGTLLEQAAGTLYTLRPTGTAYEPVPRTSIVGGRAVWAYFPQASDVRLGDTAAEFTRLLLPPGQLALIGNPSTARTLPIVGADVALGYDAVAGYVPVRELQPGQGAFVWSASGGDVSVGAVPRDAALVDARAIQAGLTQDAANVASFAQVPAVADTLLSARRYGDAQAVLDDLTSAFADGLVFERAAAPPELSEPQRAEEASVRLDLVQARTSAAAGDTVAADRAVGQARMSAQAEVDEAAQRARRQASAGGTTGLVAAPRYAAAQYTPVSLARYGTLCTAALPALSLNLPPTSQFVALVVAVLNGEPVPAG